MNTLSLGRKFWRGTWLLFLPVLTLANGAESERIYTLAEVAVVDRENKLLRRVDATMGIEANVQRLLAAGFPLADVEELKPRLVAMWGEIDPLLQIEWLDQKTVARIQELKSEYTIPMRRARLREAIYRLGGEYAPVTPTQVIARWHSAIWQLLGLDERENFALMNSASAIALCKLTKDLPTTVAERRTLCRLQQDYHGAKFRAQLCPPSQIAAQQKEALLDFWQQMRDLLGDDRFAAYLQAVDAGFRRMGGVLNQIAGVNNAGALDLWWIRKKDELADARRIWGYARNRLKDQARESATAVLGLQALALYEKNDDAKWLEKQIFSQTDEAKVSAK